MGIEKTIKISDKKVTFKSDGSLPLRYRAYFQRDYYADILSIMKSLEGNASFDITKMDMSKLDTSIFYNVIFTMAKMHDKELTDVFDWVAEFDNFPLFEVFIELQDLIMSNMFTMVDKVKKK